VRRLVDCHVHTELSGHGTGTVAQVMGAAVFRGLSGLIFTEHLPLPQGLDPENHISMPAEKLPGYASEVIAWAGRAHDLEVVLGAEADWIPGREDETAAIRDAAIRAGVSVLLGSVHFLDGWAFDDPSHIGEWAGRDVDAVWERYFAVWCEAARSGHFDVMAHPDLVKKFGYFPTHDPVELYIEAAAAAKQGGAIVEVSTAGLRKPVEQLYPGHGLLRTFCDAGVPATVGSDAHQVSEVGQDIEIAYRALADAGYAVVAFPVSRDEVRYFEL
jgi:histidinol-phosphatase (PHP family)